MKSLKIIFVKVIKGGFTHCTDSSLGLAGWILFWPSGFISMLKYFSFLGIFRGAVLQTAADERRGLESRGLDPNVKSGAVN